jgi:hypothetical protein
MSDFTEFRAPTGMDMNSIISQGYGMVQYGPGDDKLIVGFYKKSVLNAAESRNLGKPVYEGKDFVKIQHPGETLNCVDRPVNDGDKQRWPQKWAQYQAGVKQIPDGVPLNQLFPDRPQIVDMMRGYNIHTVEQLSHLSAEAIGTVGMGCQEWVNAAQRYMERVEKGINHHQFEHEINKRDQRIATLERQINDLTSLVHAREPRAPVAQNYDQQTEQINLSHQSNEPFMPAPVQFVPDLSGQVQPPRRPGRPRKIQEN